MFHRTMLRVGSIALVAASALISAPPAFAQHGHSGGGHPGGGHPGGGAYHGGGHYGGGYYGGHYGGYYRPYYPFLGLGLGLGFGYPYWGNYGSNYGGSYAYPGYSYSPAYDYSYAPAYDYYYSPPGYNANTMAQATPPVTTQSNYAPPASTALITVQLPANATLWVDDAPTTQTGAVRQFVTPGQLQPGQTYHYTLKAQWTENGQPVMRERKIDFQVGNQIVVNLNTP
jgi:uncharacterized protein (TIGR03000 family)